MLRKFKTVIYRFEEDYPVHTWKYGGMDVWPIFRTLVFVEYRNRTISNINGVVMDWKKAPRNKRFSVVGIFRRYAGMVKNKFFSGFRPLPKATPVDVMLFGSWYFRTMHEGKFINRFFEPISQLLKGRYSSPPLFVEYSVHNKFKEEYKKHKDSLLLFNELRKSKGKLPDNDIRESDFFKNFFKNLDKDIFNHQEINLIASKIEKIYLDSMVYEKLFRTYTPKYAFCLTFFNEAMFAMLFASSKTGVISVDIGHGFPIEPDNLIYNKLGNVPQQGYNTLPAIYWVWDEPIKEAMSSWVSKQNHHDVIVGGNPWLEFSRNEIKKTFLANRKVVLYTMSINLPEEYIIDALQQTQEAYEWWIRLHPSLSTSLQQVDEILKDRGVTNYNLHDANESALPELLCNCDVHISRNSSSIYESIFYGNRPIIIDEEGSKYYSKYIVEGKAFSCVGENSQELVELIRLLPPASIDKQLKPEMYKVALDLLMKKEPKKKMSINSNESR